MIRTQRNISGTWLLLGTPLVLVLWVHASMVFFASALVRTTTSMEIQRREKEIQRVVQTREEIELARWIVSHGYVAKAPSTAPAPMTQLSKADLVARLSNLQIELASLQANIRRVGKLKGEVDSRRQTKEQITQDSTVLKNRLEDLKKRLSSVQKQVVTSLAGGAVVSHGSRIYVRVPTLFIECREESYLLLPSGDKISTQLDQQGQQVLRDQLQNKQGLFFLIRPRGMGAFDALEELVRTWMASGSIPQTNVGYEPVPENDDIIVKPSSQGTYVTIGPE